MNPSVEWASPSAMTDYAHPSVHEVVLDLQYQRPVDLAVLEGIPQSVGGGWMRSTMSQFELRPDGATRVSGDTFSHWQRDIVDECRWLTRLFPHQVTLNSVRPGAWPSGNYVGWPTIGKHWEELLESLRPFYTEPLRRCGLRYINKLAIPSDAVVTDYLNVRLEAPSLLREEFDYRMRRTWKSIDGFDDLAATLSLTKVPQEQVAEEGKTGVSLDIDIFNFQVADSPDNSKLGDWFERAHAAENRVFEACITDLTRKLLEQAP